MLEDQVKAPHLLHVKQQVSPEHTDHAVRQSMRNTSSQHSKFPPGSNFLGMLLKFKSKSNMIEPPAESPNSITRKTQLQREKEKADIDNTYVTSDY